jgi:hypothetical protein
MQLPVTLYPRRGSTDFSDIPPKFPPTFYLNDFAIRNTADVTSGKPIAVAIKDNKQNVSLVMIMTHSLLL